MITEMVNWIQADRGLNFLDMNEFGKRFTEALAEESVSPATLARKLGVQPQRITHWKNRGVAAKYAVRVGEILGVEPHLIAGIVTVGPPGISNSTPRPDFDLRGVETADLFGDLDYNEFTALVVKMLPRLDPALRIAIAQAALLDLPPSVEQ